MSRTSLFRVAGNLGIDIKRAVVLPHGKLVTAILAAQGAEERKLNQDEGGGMREFELAQKTRGELHELATKLGIDKQVCVEELPYPVLVRRIAKAMRDQPSKLPTAVDMWSCGTRGYLENRIEVLKRELKATQGALHAWRNAYYPESQPAPLKSQAPFVPLVKSKLKFALEVNKSKPKPKAKTKKIKLQRKVRKVRRTERKENMAQRMLRYFAEGARMKEASVEARLKREGYRPANGYVGAALRRFISRGFLRRDGKWFREQERKPTEPVKVAGPKKIRRDSEIALPMTQKMASYLSKGGKMSVKEIEDKLVKDGYAPAKDYVRIALRRFINNGRVIKDGKWYWKAPPK